MFQALVRQAYHPLPSHQSGEADTKYRGKLVHETQLNCFYIKPGGKRASPVCTQTVSVAFLLKQSNPGAVGHCPNASQQEFGDNVLGSPECVITAPQDLDNSGNSQI